MSAAKETAARTHQGGDDEVDGEGDDQCGEQGRLGDEGPARGEGCEQGGPRGDEGEDRGPGDENANVRAG